jgi:hypothetical protein
VVRGGCGNESESGESGEGSGFLRGLRGGKRSTGERSKRVDRFFARRLGIKTNDLGSVGCTKQLAGSLTSTHRVVSTNFLRAESEYEAVREA